MNKSLVLCYTSEGQIRSQRYTWGGLYPKVSFKPYGGKRQGSEQNQFPKLKVKLFVMYHPLTALIAHEEILQKLQLCVEAIKLSLITDLLHTLLAGNRSQ